MLPAKLQVWGPDVFSSAASHRQGQIHKRCAPVAGDSHQWESSRSKR